MQVFSNGKQRFKSFIEFYVINLKYQEVKFDQFSFKYVRDGGNRLMDDLDHDAKPRRTFVTLSESKNTLNPLA